MISIHDVSKSYGSFQVLTDCSTEVARGEVVVVCGPSGSGKSTLIKCVNGLEPFQKGAITVDGISVGDPGTDLPPCARYRARRICAVSNGGISGISARVTSSPYSVRMIGS